MADGLANLLVRNGLITTSELARAVAARAGKNLLPEVEELAAAADGAVAADAERQASDRRQQPAQR